MEILKAKNINKFFHSPTNSQVLFDINMSIYESELLGIVGKSGCGKSTLLYILSTLDTDYEGSLYIANILIPKESNDALTSFRNKNIGFVFQTNFLISELNVLENVILPLRKKNECSLKEAESIGIDLLKKVGLNEYSKRNIYHLSGGQQQRVAIARSLVNSPSLIIADEPTGNLDKKTTQVVLELFQQIVQEDKKTIVVVTHDEDFSQKCNRIISLSDGKII
ncbi:ABC transporter ATP-binding protein [Spirosoma migulaei]